MHPVEGLIVVVDEGADADEGGADLGYCLAEVDDRPDQVDAPAAGEIPVADALAIRAELKVPVRASESSSSIGTQNQRLDAWLIAVPDAPEGDSCSVPMTCPTIRMLSSVPLEQLSDPERRECLRQRRRKDIRRVPLARLC